MLNENTTEAESSLQQCVQYHLIPESMLCKTRTNANKQNAKVANKAICATAAKIITYH